MRVDLPLGDAIGGYKRLQVNGQRVELGRSRALNLEVPQNQHADVPLVPILDVRALPDQRAARPDPPRSIDREVVADVRPAVVVHMPATNGPKSILGIPGTSAGERRGKPVMVHGHRPNGRHLVHPLGVGEHGRPRCSRRHIGESRIDDRGRSDARPRNHAGISCGHAGPVRLEG